MRKGRRSRKESKIKLWSLKLEREKSRESLGNGAKGSRQNKMNESDRHH